MVVGGGVLADFANACLNLLVRLSSLLSAYVLVLLLLIPLTHVKVLGEVGMRDLLITSGALVPFSGRLDLLIIVKLFVSVAVVLLQVRLVVECISSDRG